MSAAQSLQDRADGPTGPQSIGNAVRHYRASQGHSQAELARLAGISRSSVHRLERGTYRLLNVGILARIADALGLAGQDRRALFGVSPIPVRPGAAVADAPSFGALLRRERVRAGLTQGALARACGMTASAICRFEGGERTEPGRRTVRALSRALGLGRAGSDALLTVAGYAPSYGEDATIRQLAALLAGDVATAATLRAMVEAAYRAMATREAVS